MRLFQHSDWSSSDPEYAGFAPRLDEIAEVTLGGKKYRITKSYAEYLEWTMKKNMANRP